MERLSNDIARTSNEAAPVAGKKGRAFEGVQNHILEQIRSGALKTGSKLPPERELAASLGVARQAVREALRSLEMSGVLRFELGVNGGAFVRETGSDGIAFSIKNMFILGRLPVNDLLEMRACLCGEAARLGTLRGTPEDYRRIELMIDLMEERHQTAVLHSTDQPALETYRLLARASHNPLLVLLANAVFDVIGEMVAGRPLKSRDDHIKARREMLAAMRAGDAAGAERIIRAHALKSNQRLMEALPYNEKGPSLHNEGV